MLIGPMSRPLSVLRWPVVAATGQQRGFTSSLHRRSGVKAKSHASKPWLPKQVNALPKSQPQSSLTKILRDTSSVEASRAIEDVRHRRVSISESFLQDLGELQQRRREASSELNAAGQDAKNAKAAVAAFMKRRTQREPTNGTENIDGSDEQATAALAGEEAKLLAESRSWRQRMDTLREQEEDLAEQIRRIVTDLPNASHPDSPKGSEVLSNVVGVHRGRRTSATLPPNELAALRAVASAEGSFSLQQWQTVVAQNKPLREASPPGTHLTLTDEVNPQPTLDMAAGRLATGPSFPYLLGPLAVLEQALLRYATSIADRHGFTLVSAPNVVRTQIAERCGFNPRGGEGSQTYFVHSSSHDSADSSSELCLVGTAEISLAALLAGRTFSAQQLPVKVFAISPSFRAEAGARGTDTKGLYRLHQFNKAEMFVAASNSGDASDNVLEELCEIQQKVLAGLGLTFRILDMSTEELGASAYRKYDIEAWMPGRAAWGEVSSASNCTDYQSSRLHILQEGSGKGEKAAAAHTLNATLCAVPRVIIALVEQYGVDEQSHRLRLPDVLRPHWIGASTDNVEWVADETSSSTPPSPAPTEASSLSYQARGMATSARSSPPPPSEPTSLFGRLRDRLKVVSERTGTDIASLTASFFILHEVTAIAPLIALFYLLGFFGLGEALCNWFLEAAEEAQRTGRDGAEPTGETASFQTQWRIKIGSWMSEGMQRAERFARRKGWWGFDKSDASRVTAQGQDPTSLSSSQQLAGAFANAVAAYVLTKALLVPRLFVSFWLAPSFARRVFEPAKRVAKRLNGRRKA